MHFEDDFLHLLTLSDFDSLEEEDVAENNQLAFDIAEREFGIQPVIRGEEMAAAAEPDQLLMVLYLSKFQEAFRSSPANGSGQVPPCFLHLGFFPQGGGRDVALFYISVKLVLLLGHI